MRGVTPAQQRESKGKKETHAAKDKSLGRCPAQEPSARVEEEVATVDEGGHQCDPMDATDHGGVIPEVDKCISHRSPRALSRTDSLLLQADELPGTGMTTRTNQLVVMVTNWEHHRGGDGQDEP